ncbi:hypothetical protein E3E36_06915 [Thermococcus sp. M36]|uniref:hypothetical protein n=1 Tax=Thermococcus sp. M36 TaxID=1638261 RepID=UPI00143A222E|nr:hypothetical protein [Thermococcus sp. M36]NJE05877.1 hypothetical protein [Thermococcus sp. M36]
MTVGESGDMVYEALGSYIDDLCGSIFVGTARGKAIMYLRKKYPLTPEDGLPFMNIFYTNGALEITSIWNRRGERGAFLITGAPEGVEVRDGGVVYITFRFGKAVVLVTVHGGPGLAKTLEDVTEECTGAGKRLISSRLVRPWDWGVSI